ncbi:MAG: hypothetical protein JO320_03300 [Alphaproteobacteria bacterium]|nr:hypothetical protein [Alphaproteobacteria bacterium]MBV9374080.1 hypothetical protein [Alphaproteobacteria bacterium]
MERKATDTVQLKLRIREDLRQRIEAEANARKISLNAVMVERLERSFDDASMAIRLPYRADLQRVAAEQGRSIRDEIERRLERSLIDDLIMYGEHGPAHIRQAVQTIASVFSSLEMMSGRKAFGPDGDPWLHEQAWKALNLWFGASRPPGEAVPPKQLPKPAYRRNRREMENLGLELMAHRIVDKQPSGDELRSALEQLNPQQEDGDKK